MKARILRPEDLDDAHWSRWQAIVDRGGVYANPFYSPHFTRAVGQSRADAFVAIIERDGETQGFFPFHRVNGDVGKPIGGPINDYHGPVLEDGFRPSATELLAACGLNAYDFNHMPTAFEAFSASSYVQSRSPHINLTDGYDAYAGAQGKSFNSAMRAVRRRSRKIEREIGPLQYVFHDGDHETYARHRQFKNEMLKSLKVASILDVSWAAQTLDIIRNTQEPEFAGLMTTLHAGDRMVAAHFGMRSRTVWHWWFSSYDMTLSNYGGGINLINQSAQCANEHGITLMDFGRGESDYKYVFANGYTPLCEGSVERAGSAPGVLRKAQKFLVKAATPLPLGKYESYPRRALARFISGMRLPN